MRRTIEIAPADLEILRDVFTTCLPNGVAVWAFGSRAAGAARQYSDLDLALEGAGRLESGLIAHLRDALSVSDLTIKVDVIDLCAVDPAFRQLIEREMIRLLVRNEGESVREASAAVADQPVGRVPRC